MIAALETIRRKAAATPPRQIPLKAARKLGRWALFRMPPENRMGDYFVAYIAFWLAHGRAPSKQMRFNDVLFRLKTSNTIRNPLRTFIADKEYVKFYVRSMVGDQYNVPTLAVMRTAEEIDAATFPQRCCIKPTHASGEVVIRRDNEEVDREWIKRWLSWDYYRTDRALEYKDLEPKVIVEPLVYDRTNVEDYKIFCYRGEPKLIQVDVDRYIAHSRRFFDSEWNELDFSIIYPKSDAAVSRPGNLDEMLSVASRLSEPFSFIRIDLYSDGDTIYVGEITNCSEGANGNFVPSSAEQWVSELVFGSDATIPRADERYEHAPRRDGDAG